MVTELVLSPALDLSPALLYASTPKAKRRVAEFFTTQINNDHNRKAYLDASRRLAVWLLDRRGRKLLLQRFDKRGNVDGLDGRKFLESMRFASTWPRCACCLTGW